MNFGGNNNYDALLSGLGSGGYSTNPVVAATGGFTQNRGTNQTVDLWDYSTPKTTTVPTTVEQPTSWDAATGSAAQWSEGANSAEDVLKAVDNLVASASNDTVQSGVRISPFKNYWDEEAWLSAGKPDINTWEQSEGSKSTEEYASKWNNSIERAKAILDQWQTDPGWQSLSTTPPDLANMMPGSGWQITSDGNGGWQVTASEQPVVEQGQ